ncbi:hypothetical protein [Microbispora sp. KK1-11]|uniref:hypothetical protein n=1 Tax=Microbispora sp. KK1-11 TaxID=2053005 RepID=UPI0011588B0C|nr:hypothetical protein [Microbispora sp. KK1-11]TQS31028.1 hypothetical protein FLW16_01740 [Microbispora sp. KK1-11]
MASRRSALALSVAGALVLGAPTAPAYADNSTKTGSFGSGRHIEVRVWKAPGNNNPGFSTSVWTYNGAALWKVDWVKDVTTVYVNSVSGFSVSYAESGGPSGTVNTSGTELSLEWTNENAYESEVKGNISNSVLTTISTKVCGQGSAYSRSLGIASSVVSTCAGWF